MQEAIFKQSVNVQQQLAYGWLFGGCYATTRPVRNRAFHDRNALALDSESG